MKRQYYTILSKTIKQIEDAYIIYVITKNSKYFKLFYVPEWCISKYLNTLSVKYSHHDIHSARIYDKENVYVYTRGSRIPHRKVSARVNLPCYVLTQEQFFMEMV